MAKVMMTIRSPEGAPSTSEVCQKYGLDNDEFDKDFGVVEIDRDKHLYTVLVEEEAAKKISADQDWKVEGPYSNPRIAPFGPPEKE